MCTTQDGGTTTDIAQHRTERFQIGCNHAAHGSEAAGQLVRRQEEVTRRRECPLRQRQRAAEAVPLEVYRRQAEEGYAAGPRYRRRQRPAEMVIAHVEREHVRPHGEETRRKRSCTGGAV